MRHKYIALAVIVALGVVGVYALSQDEPYGQGPSVEEVERRGLMAYLRLENYQVCGPDIVGPVRYCWEKSITGDASTIWVNYLASGWMQQLEENTAVKRSMSVQKTAHGFVVNTTYWEDQAGFVHQDKMSCHRQEKTATSLNYQCDVEQEFRGSADTRSARRDQVSIRYESPNGRLLYQRHIDGQLKGVQVRHFDQHSRMVMWLHERHQQDENGQLRRDQRHLSLQYTPRKDGGTTQTSAIKVVQITGGWFDRLQQRIASWGEDANTAPATIPLFVLEHTKNDEQGNPQQIFSVDPPLIFTFTYEYWEKEE